jgi:hypothetical protein
MALTTARRYRAHGRSLAIRTEARDSAPRGGIELIAMAVIAQAAEDVRSGYGVHRADALAFVDDSEGFRAWCAVAGLAPERARSAVLGGME